MGTDHDDGPDELPTPARLGADRAPDFGTVQALDATVPVAGQLLAGTVSVQPNEAQQPPSAVAATVPFQGSSVAAGTDAARPATPATTGQSDESGGNRSPDNAAAPPIQADAAYKAQPVPGANSFTPEEARRRIERHGFNQVSELHKDGAGVWRGHAMKAGQRVGIWLDYKGNVGQP